jgi:thiol:disulfide interchange protein DsbD
MKASIRLACLAAAALGLSGAVMARPWWMRGVESNESDFLPPDVAFRVSSRVDGTVLRVRWVIADGYYLYRSKMEIKAESADLVVLPPTFPRGLVKTDAYLGTQEIFEQQVEATAPFTRSDFGAHPLQIKVTYQGCATAGLCYPAITKVIFPVRAAAMPPGAPHPWEGVAIIGGGLSMLLAGLVLRKSRHLDTPAA